MSWTDPRKFGRLGPVTKNALSLPSIGPSLKIVCANPVKARHRIVSRKKDVVRMGGIPRGSARGHSHSRPLYGDSSTELSRKCSVFPFWYSEAREIAHYQQALFVGRHQDE